MIPIATQLFRYMDYVVWSMLIFTYLKLKFFPLSFSPCSVQYTWMNNYFCNITTTILQSDTCYPGWNWKETIK